MNLVEQNSSESSRKVPRITPDVSFVDKEKSSKGNLHHHKTNVDISPKQSCNPNVESSIGSDLKKTTELVQASDSITQSESSVLQPDMSSSEVQSSLNEPSPSFAIESPVIIEMFCVTARVTACLKAIGLKDSFGVDHIKSKAVSAMKLADLTTSQGQKLFLSWLESPMVQGIFIAPPCGTCSLARTIQLRDEKGRPIPGPVPLRSLAAPEGLPNLSAKNRLRVSLANKLYEFVGRVLRIADSKGLIIVVGNPRSSLFWATRWWQKCGVKFMYTAHQACAYGSSRPKWTVLAHIVNSFIK